jgi:hypothetical protein
MSSMHIGRSVYGNPYKSLSVVFNPLSRARSDIRLRNVLPFLIKGPLLALKDIRTSAN